MKGFKVVLLAVVLVLSISVDSLHAGEKEKVTGSASIGIFNKYVFRGYELSSGSAVLQPTIAISYKGFSANFWGNIDSNGRQTQSFFPDREGHKRFKGFYMAIPDSSQLS